MPAPLKIGSRIEGTVYRILSDRILLRLPGGAHGIIRRREMSWDNPNVDPHSLVQRNESVQALVIKIDANQKSVELSLRFAQRDPWQELLQHYQVGSEAHGIVQNVRDFGAFVEIEPGVVGLVPTSELRIDERTKEGHEVVWVGDHVLTLIKDIDLSQRHIMLSIKDYLKHYYHQEGDIPQERNRTPLADRLAPETLRKLRQAIGDIPEALELPEPGRIQTVLVVDDNQEFRQSLAALLREWRYRVAEAKDTQETRQHLSQQPFDLIILDFFLNDGITIELAEEINAKYPAMEMLLLSGSEVEEDIEQRAAKQSFTFEYKPYGASHLAAFLRRLETGASASTTLSASTKSQLPHTTTLISPKTGDIQAILQTLITAMRAKGAVLFAQDEEKSGEVQGLYREGVEITGGGDVYAMLLHSPVGDVIREQRSVTIRNISDNPEQSKYLHQAVAFRSCVGTPVHILFRHRPYALFVFSDKPNTFSHQDSDTLQRAAYELELLLSRQGMADFFFSRQNEFVRSQLRAGALHDLRNTLGSMDFKLPRLVAQARRLEQHLEAAAPLEETRQDVVAIRSLVDELQTAAEQMKRTADLVREVGSSEHMESIEVNAIVRRIVGRHEPLASHLNVTLEFVPAPSLPATFLNATYLQQAVDNVILNALQWCAERLVRRVLVTTGTTGGEPHLPIKLRVADTGPGIHQQLQEYRIYELGFSKREKGSGLGLFVARTLLESMQGKISVERSIIEVGTTFLIELPVRKSTLHTEPAG
jgi:signal transduction histidine kinase